MNPLVVEGRVEKGEGMATKLGCPTANIAIEQGGVIPALGVYVGYARVDHVSYPSLICISDGRTGNNLKLEVHLLHQTLDLNQKHLCVTLIEKLRDIIPFPGDEEMAKVICEDMKNANQWFLDHVDS